MSNAKHKSNMGSQGRMLGPLMNRKGKRPCGICGEVKLLSKAHVPPRCAGNEMLVKRYRFMMSGHEADSGRGDLGGIYLYGLCAKCNTLAGEYDSAYGALAASLQSLWIKSWTIEVPPRIKMPPIEFDPGSVVRSILLGMCATGDLIYQNDPALPLALTKGELVELPSTIRLYLALARGRTARVAGSIAGFHVMGPNIRRDQNEVPIGINSLASVYFPPLAWELVHTGDTTLVPDGWANVGTWTELRPGDIHRLSDLVTTLPAVCHPWHHPSLSEGWTELTNTNHVPIVECENIEGGSRDPQTPLTVTKRAVVSIDQFTEMARRNGATT